jgi:acyl-CoA thioesterase-1
MTTSRIRIGFLGNMRAPRRAYAPATRGTLRNWLASIVVLAGLAAAPASYGTPERTLLVLGDSISAAYGIQREQGWVRQLEERLASVDPSWRVVNASVSGETTGGGLARLPAALAAHDPAVVVIELGGNDGLRGYPLGKIRENLAGMVQLARSAGGEVLLVGMQIPPNYGPRYTRGFAGLFEEVARQHDVALVPFLLEQVALTPAMMQSDGIHPTADAQPLLLETLWPHLEPLLEKAGGN